MAAAVRTGVVTEARLRRRERELRSMAGEITTDRPINEVAHDAIDDQEVADEGSERKGEDRNDADHNLA